MKNIEIDFECYKELTSNLIDEEDTYNDVLRRLLKLPQFKPKAGTQNNANTLEWMSKGRGFPEGTEFRAVYDGKEYTAEVKGGKFVYDGEVYRSFSGAACKIAGTQRNGWDFWEQKRPGSNTWIKLY